LKQQIETLMKMQAKIVEEGHQSKELLKLVLRGALDGNISEEDCKRLGMTEAEIRDYVRKIKEGDKKDGEAFDKLS